ncbi:DNA topoisomerase III [Paenibacillus radicis (ex Gao et al. 2016)]|uniref:DNA topoisomerase n=1 Tax=Paenibacillus radicis (ex Gao et al. 2016) TaxID=1737354 RepID=A0A917M4Z1_9BACL|nr:DNA topoisomerase III [Paenibacillus radicis (ex Gao et al. 2016)]GGG75748.1 DNA topoisomerase III [Paenibacillus radicis (ex Gao et al. 2016)]
MKSLVLAEKPSVARELARVLGCSQKNKSYIEGPKYVVTWALGHLVTLAEPEEYDAKYKTWSLEDLPLLPPKMNLKVMKETSHQYKAVAQLCRRQDIGELIIATDAGREGELVARWIMELVHWRKPFKRLWISSQTDKAIKDGFQALKPGKDYNNLYASAVCRAEADWLIGLNVTRALTVKYNAQLAAGRVQTPTLGAMMDREKEIQQFQSQPYWTISADLGGFQAVWRESDSHDGRVWNREAAEAAAGRLNGKGAKVDKLRTVEKTEPHPQAYDLTELQRDANKRLGFSAKQTSNVLQKLYEQHKLVTYPRTDSKYLSSDIVPTLKGRLESIAVGSYSALARKLLRGQLPVTKRFVDDSKVSDHHAIIPTEQFVNLSALSNEERRLYDLIVRRFIALFYAPYRYDETSVTLTVGTDKLYAKGKIMKDMGWKELYSGEALRAADDDEDEEEDGRSGQGERQPEQLLPALTQGQTVPVKQSRVKELRTMPPARYTEASLLSKMEKHGLGTPATRADIIEKLLSTDTIERSQNRLIPTGKGKQLIELVVEELRSPDLTAQWERELERIAQGKGEPAKFMASIREQASKWVTEVKNETKEYKPHNLTHSRCPECGKLLMEVKGKRGKSLVCSDRECSYRRATEPALSNKRCPQCHKKMEIHDGKAGKYAQCRPCNVIEMLGDKQGGRVNKHQQKKMIEQFSDNVSLSNSLADALKAAMEKNKE